MSEEFLFADDTEEEVSPRSGFWKVLIVDDEAEIHAVTKLALSEFEFHDKGLTFISAHSGEEAKRLFTEHDDIAIVLLDVVMETDDAGLQVADYIRNVANNHFTRIILRTGQPGQAPEKEVILNYDINDYKSKTELTAQRLFATIIATLRSYRDIMVIEQNRQGLEKILRASTDLFSIRSLENFVEGIVQQLAALLGGSRDAVYITSAVAGPHPINAESADDFYVFAGRGEFESYEGKRLSETLKGKELELCQRALRDKSVVYEDDYVAAYCQGNSIHGALLYLSGLPNKLSDSDKYFIELFSKNVQLAFDNVLLTRDLEATHREVLMRLAQGMEHHLVDTKHAHRMVHMCDLLGRHAGLAEHDLETLKLAVPLHDIGKLKVATDIINKPGPLTDAERKTIRQHAEWGYNLLKDSKRPVIRAAATVARDHHEHWDGNGYPRGLKGEEIHIFARITAIADVYDALRSKLPYKEKWTEQKVLDWFQQQRAKQFDPHLVDILLAHIKRIEQIQATYDDDNNDLEFKIVK